MIPKNNNLSIKMEVNIKNIKIKKIIEEILEKNKYINVFLTKNNKQILAVKNEQNELAYIYTNDDNIYIYNNTLNKYEEISYDKQVDKTIIQILKLEKLKKVGIYEEINEIEENYSYDENGILINHKLKHTNMIYNTLAHRLASSLQFCNYTNYIEDHLIENKIIRVSTTNYDYHKEHNRIQYFESDYEEGNFLSGDETKDITPKFIEISEEKYKNNLKKLKQKQKNMI